MTKGGQRIKAEQMFVWNAYGENDGEVFLPSWNGNAHQECSQLLCTFITEASIIILLRNHIVFNQLKNIFISYSLISKVLATDSWQINQKSLLILKYNYYERSSWMSSSSFNHFHFFCNANWCSIIFESAIFESIFRTSHFQNAEKKILSSFTYEVKMEENVSYCMK